MAEEHGATLESLVPRLLAYALHWIPWEMEDRAGLAQQSVYDAFEELLEHDVPDFRDERELFRRVAGIIRRRIDTAARSDAS